jgi:hypothetical protein
MEHCSFLAAMRTKHQVLRLTERQTKTPAVWQNFTQINLR